MRKSKIILLFLISLIILSSCSNNSKILEYRKEGINLIRNKNYKDALEYFNIAISYGEGEVGEIQYDLLLYKAECLFMLENYLECRDIYELLLKIKPNNKQYLEIYNLLNGVSKLSELRNSINNNELQDAKTIIEDLKKLGIEHDKSVLFNQAVIYEKEGEWKSALNAFNYYLTQYPNDDLALKEIKFINTQLTR